MAAMGRSTLRDRFDEAPTPHIAHPPYTHHRDFYVATDGSFSRDGGGLGAIIETGNGERVTRLAVADHPPDNNVAEYRALHLGLDTLAAHAPADASVGIVLDHDDLAANVNAAVLAARGPDFRPLTDFTHPPGVHHHWRGIRARIVGFDEVRAATVVSRDNPAHPLANSPTEFAHVNRTPARPERRTRGGSQVPPPSRADRNASD
ncbi:ribonuclease H family protein [Halanaeroarchaeum sulfurireducens]|uniref:Ribonuclease HI n=1 Tax=Halanaeroarchaeum sulfurireducens TaxID=1604004 RepID=A0A0F7PFA2_9EURY|nr:ribonuclease H [Halanaeroarchaeum sulfurireducens]AKH98199.1 ribonuclease HI [Halanaeroarchaeum sulfurireducens]ALG82593.1 ribonuclease HI [Halanaeroarchaeum sulfurireducens]